MTTVLTIVALMLVASAIWGWGSRSGTDASRSKREAAADLSGRQRAGSSKNVAMRPIQDLGAIATRPRWMDYVPLTILFFCFLIIDTRTWLQGVLLSFLALAAAFLQWFCLSRVNRHKRDANTGTDAARPQALGKTIRGPAAALPKAAEQAPPSQQSNKSS